MSDASRTAYLFQCEGEDLFAVSFDATGRQHSSLALHIRLDVVRDVRAWTAQSCPSASVVSRDRIAMSLARCSPSKLLGRSLSSDRRLPCAPHLSA